MADVKHDNTRTDDKTRLEPRRSQPPAEWGPARPGMKLIGPGMYVAVEIPKTFRMFVPGKAEPA